MNDNGSPGRGEGIIKIVLALILVSVASGTIIGFGLFVVAITIKMSNPWIYLGLGFGIAVITTWIVILKKAIYLVERIYHVDINQDGVYGDPDEQDTQPEPQRETLQPLWIAHDDGRVGSELHHLPAPKADTLVQMALILHVRGFDYFNQDNFTTPAKGTQLMPRDYWTEKFIPAMLAARLASENIDSRGRSRVALTKRGESMFNLLAEKYGSPDAPLPQ